MVLTDADVVGVLRKANERGDQCPSDPFLHPISQGQRSSCPNTYGVGCLEMVTQAICENPGVIPSAGACCTCCFPNSSWMVQPRQWFFILNTFCTSYNAMYLSRWIGSSWCYQGHLYIVVFRCPSLSFLWGPKGGKHQCAVWLSTSSGRGFPYHVLLLYGPQTTLECCRGTKKRSG